MTRSVRILAACGLALVVLGGCSSDDPKPSATPTTLGGGPTTTVRPVDTSFTGANSAQFCALAKTYIDRSSNLGAGATSAQLRTASQDARTAITQAAAAAPAEIKNDAQTVSNAFVALFTELERANFDPTKLSPTALAPLQTPELATATTRFQAYLHQVCGTA
jgi:hypothetical protein